MADPTRQNTRRDTSGCKCRRTKINLRLINFPSAFERWYRPRQVHLMSNSEKDATFDDITCSRIFCEWARKIRAEKKSHRATSNVSVSQPSGKLLRGRGRGKRTRTSKFDGKRKKMIKMRHASPAGYQQRANQESVQSCKSLAIFKNCQASL